MEEINFMGIFEESALSQLSATAVTLFKNLLLAFLVYYAGGWVIRRIVHLVRALLEKRGVEPSLSGFLVSIVNAALWLMLIIAVITILGIETSSFVALFTGAGMAIGMAMSGTLGNFSGGVMILLFKPYKVGEYIKAQGYEGIVKEVQIFNTILVTVDNRTIIIPNGGLSTGSLENVSRQKYRRVDLNFDFAYGTDYEVVRKAIADIQARCPQIIKEISDEIKADREPVALPCQILSNLGESGVTISTRSWCLSKDYWAVYSFLNETVYQDLRNSGYMFPFNQLDVNLNK